MNPAQMWWLENTATGRRLLDRMLPASAIPPHTRRQICDEQGHDTHSTRDGRCVRCGELPPTRR